MLTIEIYDELELLAENELYLLNEVREVLQFTFKYVRNVQQSYELDITLTNNDTIREINNQYRGINAITDVISFAFEDVDDEITIPGSMDIPKILGELFISIPKARAQAEEYGHSFEREFLFLSVHGMLHLLGYDHMNPEDEKEMFQLQDVILNKFNIER